MTRREDSERQLPLDLAHAEGRSRAHLVVSRANEAAVSLIDRWPDWPLHAALVVGPAGSGKSHLANVWCLKANAPLVAASALDEAAVGAFEASQALVVEDIDRAAYERLFDIHVWGTLAATRAVLPEMKAKKYGRIVNISSNRAQVGFERSSHYAAAKAAVLGFAKAWAREFASYGILVNAVAPGVVRTGMTLRSGQEALDEDAAPGGQPAGTGPEIFRRCRCGDVELVLGLELSRPDHAPDAIGRRDGWGAVVVG